MKRAMQWSLGPIVVIIIVWTGVWFGARWWLGNTMHQSMADLSSTNDTVVTCTGETIGGWPFELTVSCGGGLSVALPDGGKLKTTNAQGEGSVFNPLQLDFRFDAPISYTRPDGRRFDITANGLVASIGFSKNRADRFALETTGLSATGPLAVGTDGKLTVNHGEILLTRADDRPEDADIAATIDGLSLAVGRAMLVPVPVRLTLAATLAEADMATAGPAALAGWKAAGGKLTLRRLAAELGGATLTLSGEGTVSETGLIEANGKVIGRDLNALAVAAAAGGHSLTPEVAGLVMAFVFMGSSADDGGRSIGLKITDGVVSANGREIGRLAPLF